MDGAHETLRRIALLLLALAVLAERASSRGHAVRCLVLSFLRPAEAAASALAARSAPLLADCPSSDNRPDDAARLAQRLRALACVFFVLSRQVSRRVRRRAAQRRDSGRKIRSNAGRRPVALPRSRAPPTKWAVCGPAITVPMRFIEPACRFVLPASPSPRVGEGA